MSRNRHQSVGRPAIAIVGLALFAAMSITLPGCAPSRAADDADDEQWIQLFNGRDLGGWDLKITGFELNDNFNNTFRVEDGLLRVAYDQYQEWGGQFGHIFYREPFSYYILRIEYRFTGEQPPGSPRWAFRNNGIMFHSQSARSMGLNQDFPISVEVQLLGGSGSGQRPTMNMCSPGTHVMIDGQLVDAHCVNSRSKTFHGDDWVHAELRVYGDSLIQHFVEGDLVMEYSKPQIGGGAVNNFDPAVKQDGRLLTEGLIALQAESHPTDFRRIELLDLVGCTDPDAANYRSYFVKSDNTRCVYR